MNIQPTFTFRTLLTNFLSWIVYGILSAMGHIEAAFTCGLIISLWQAISIRRKHKSLNIMDSVTLLFFIAGVVSTFVLHSDFFHHNDNAIIWGVLAIIAWGSLLLGAPFTAEYARDSVPETLWKTTAFRLVNVVITAVWGIVFVINLAIALLETLHSSHFISATIFLFNALPYVSLIFAIVFTNRYPQWVKDKAQADENIGVS
jgi:intracellular septation protein A